MMCPECKRNYKRMERLALRMEEECDDLYLEERFNAAERAVVECDCQEKED